MEDLLAKIYQLVICNEEASIKMAEKYDKQIDEILEEYKENVATVDDEQLRALLYDVAYVTEQGGFVLGAQFIEYSCAVTPTVRQTGNRLSGTAETACASLLA